MKTIAYALPLLVGLPSMMSAQVNLSLPGLRSPAVRATWGPIAVVATVSGVTVRSRSRAPRHTPGAEARHKRDEVDASAARVLATGDRYLGTPYRYGGGSPEGFDCSGFVQYVFGLHGIKLPRTSRQQSTVGRALPNDTGSLQPGDLLLFSSRGRGVNHVAIYAGNSRFIHATAGRGKVVYDDFSTPRGRWYLARHVGSRRVL